MIDASINYKGPSFQKLTAEDFSGDKEESEIYGDLYCHIIEIKNNLSTISNEDLYNRLIGISEIVNRISDISDYFIKDLNIISLFSQILQSSNNHEIFEITLIILQGLIYLSQDALDIFIQLDFTDFLIENLFENSKSFDDKDYIVSTTLGILQKLIESEESNLGLKILPQIFNFVEICQNRINDNSEVKENLKICFGIYGSFIRINEKDVLTQFLNKFIEIQNFLKSPFYQEFSIPIVCDLAEKGFINEILESDLYRICLDLLNDESFKKSYEYIVKLIVQILSIFENANSEEMQSESFELNHDNLIRFVPFNRIYELFKLYKNEETQKACLLLYEKIASLGGLKILLDQEVDGKNKELLSRYLDNSYYSIKLQVFHLLWNGLLNLNNSVDQIELMNSPIFASMTSNVYFLDNTEFICSILSFFDHILSLNSGSVEKMLNEDTFNCMISFAQECISYDNEELVQCAK